MDRRRPALPAFARRLLPSRRPADTAPGDAIAGVAGRTVVLAVHAGGLGDHLAYSALPRLYKRAGAARVLLSSRTNCGEPFARNREIAELVWRDNPFVDGMTDEPANVGERGWPPMEFFRAAKTQDCPIDTVAAVHGLPVLGRDGNTRVLPPRPDLFYRPRLRAEFTDTVVCDPRSISQPFSAESFGRFGRFLERWHGIRLDEAVVLGSPHAGPNGAETLPANPRRMVSDLWEYADIVASARAFLVTESGGQSLAAALREARTFVLMTTRSFNERLFLWPANTYFVTSDMTPGEAEWP